MDNGCIYKITCKINNKSYIGQHNNEDPEKRWYQHKKDCEKGLQFPIYSAFRKHGIKNFDFDVIYIGCLHSLNIMELYFAEIHKSYIWDDCPGGYNMKMCGNYPLGTIADINEVKQYIDIIDDSRELSLQRRLSLLNND